MNKFRKNTTLIVLLYNAEIILVMKIYINKQLTKSKAVLRFPKYDEPSFTTRNFYLLQYMFENKYAHTKSYLKS